MARLTYGVKSGLGVSHPAVLTLGRPLAPTTFHVTSRPVLRITSGEGPEMISQ